MLLSRYLCGFLDYLILQGGGEQLTFSQPSSLFSIIIIFSFFFTSLAGLGGLVSVCSDKQRNWQREDRRFGCGT